VSFLYKFDHSSQIGPSFYVHFALSKRSSSAPTAASYLSDAMTAELLNLYTLLSILAGNPNILGISASGTLEIIPV